MFVIIAKWILNGIALLIVSKIVPGIIVADFSAALVAALVIGLVNVVIKPILVILTLPINILTLGLFTFVINAALLQFAGMISPGFLVEGFGSALIGSIVLTIVSALLHAIIRA